MASIIKISIVGNARDAVRAFRETDRAAEKTKLAMRENAREVAKNQATIKRSINGLTTDLGIFGQVSAIASSRAALWAGAITLAVGPAFQLAGALRPLLGLLVGAPAALAGALGIFGALKIALSGAGGAIGAGFALTPADMKKAEVAHRQSLLAVSQAQSAYNKILKTSQAQTLIHTKVTQGASSQTVAHTKTVKASTVSELDKANALERLRIAQANVTDTQTAYTKALDALPPATRAFVKSIVDQRSAWDALKAQVSSALLTPFTNQVKTLGGRYLPILSKGLGTIALAIGTVVSDLITAVTTSKPLATGLKAIFGETADGVRRSGSSIRLLVDDFGRLLFIGAPILRIMGSLTGKVAGQFGGWLNRMAKAGTLKKWLNDGVTAARQLWTIGRNLTGILNSVFRLGGEGSGTLLSNISRITASFDAFLKSPKGSADVRQLFKDLRDTTYVIWQTLVTLAPLVSSVGGAFGRDVLPVLKQVSDWLTRHKREAALVGEALLLGFGISRVSRVLGAIGKIAKAIKGLIVLEGTADALSLLNPAGILLAAGALGVYLGYLERKNHTVQNWWNSWTKSPGGSQFTDALGREFDRTERDWKSLTRAWNTFTRDISSAWNAFTGFFQRRYDITVSFWTNLPHRIAGVFLGLGNTLRNAGTTAMDSFLSGARSRWASVRKFFTDLTQSVRQWKGPPATDAMLLHGAGQSIMDGLIKGIDSRVPKLRSALSGVTSAISGGIAGPSVSVQPARMPDSHVHIHLAPGVKTIDAERELHQMLLSFQRRTGIKLLVSNA
jgi:hypothetical protein